MQHFIKDPLNLNTAGESDLNELKIFTPLQLHNFFSYRNLMGRFINIYELQAIPGWDVSLIRKIRSYVTVGNSGSLLYPLKTRFKNGENILLVRVARVLEKSRGYLPGNGADNYYPGNPQKMLLRYKYQ